MAYARLLCFVSTFSNVLNYGTCEIRGNSSRANSNWHLAFHYNRCQKLTLLRGASNFLLAIASWRAYRGALMTPGLLLRAVYGAVVLAFAGSGSWTLGQV